MIHPDLATRPKAITDGTHRTCSPAETVANVMLVAERLGVTRVADVTGLDHVGIPVVTVVRPLGTTLSVAQGKGISLDHAKASGVMEAIELLHAENLLATATLDSVADLTADESSVLARLRYSQIDRRSGAQGIGDQSLGGPHEFSGFGASHASDPLKLHAPSVAALPVYPTTNMISGNVLRLPLDAVRLDHRSSATAYRGLSMTSNGLASGNTFDEAAAHALCEVIEREAVCCWNDASWAERRGWRLDLRSVDDPICRSLLSRFDAADIAVAVWDISTAGIAAFHCMIVDRQPQPVRPVGSASGSGAHPSRAIALSRALTEAAQSRLTTISGARDDLLPSWYRIVTSANYLDGIRSLVAGVEGGRQFAQAPEHFATTSAGDVDFLIERLTTFGAREVLVADLTHDDFDVPVVKAIVPGLREAGTTGWQLTEAEPVPLAHKHNFACEPNVDTNDRRGRQATANETPTLTDRSKRDDERRRIVFAGPTVTSAEVAARCPGATCAGPAQSGDVLAAIDAGFDTIVLIDGRYDLVGSVWHKEILAALAQGVVVVGCASMGALRASELERFGMIGWGRVFDRLRRTGFDDDDVAVAHAGPDDGYRSFNIAMVELNATVGVCSAKGLLRPSEAELVERSAKQMFYADRNLPWIMQAAMSGGLGSDRAAEIHTVLRKEWIAQKHLDAIEALDHLAQIEASFVPIVDVAMPWTTHLDDLRAETQGNTTVRPWSSRSER